MRGFLFTHAVQSIDALERVGKFSAFELKRQLEADAPELLRDGHLHRGLTPDDILVTVGGGDAGGHSAFLPSWSRTRGSIMQSKPIGVCIDC